jgi:NEDD4-binding protein 2
MDEGVYKFDIKKLGDAHKWNQERAFVALKEKKSPIVIDNTNLQAWEPRPYVVKALEHGYRVEIREPETPWKKDASELAKRNVRTYIY